MSLLRRFGGEEPSQNHGDNNAANRMGPMEGPGGIGTPDAQGGGSRYNPVGSASVDPRLIGNAPAGGGASAKESTFFELKRKVQNALITELDPKLDLSQTAH